LFAKPSAIAKETTMFMRKMCDTLRNRWGLADAFTSARRKRRARPLVERLEDRCVPATITVTTLDDTVPLMGVVRLRDAIQMANADPAADTIVFASGLSGPINLLGPLMITAPLTIQGLGAGNTVIHGGPGGADIFDQRIFDISAAAGDVTLDGLTLTGGHTTGNNQNKPQGTPADFTYDGGAIQFLSPGTLTIRNSTLSGNSTMKDALGMGATLAGGGAIFASGGAVVIDHSTLSGNYSSKWRGGAVYSIVGAVTVTNSTLSGNHTGGTNANGGAIFSANGSVTITNSTLSGNHTDGTYARGGAIFVRHDIPSLPTPTVTITNSILSGNFTRGDRSAGGAVYARQDTNVTLTDSTLYGNYTQGNANGGGILSDAGTVTIRNSTIVKNSAGGSGGGFFKVSGSSTVVSSIIAGNNDVFGHPDLAAVNVTLSHSLVGNNKGTGLIGTGPYPDVNGNLIGTDANPIDPMLGPLANHGGPTQTMTLLPNSQAIDGGANNLTALSAVLAAGTPPPPTLQVSDATPLVAGLVIAIDDEQMQITAVNGTSITVTRGFDSTTASAHLLGAPVRLAFDQRGSPREVGAQADMGALESGFLVSTAADVLDATKDPNHLSLRDAVDLANKTQGPTTISFAPRLHGTPILLTQGELLLTNSMTILGLGAANTTIDAQHRSLIFDIAGGDVTLDGLTLTGGHGGPASLLQNGGAISAGGTALRVKNSVLSGNSSAGPGGAIAMHSNGLVALYNSTVSGNFTTGQGSTGGGIWAGTGDVFAIGSTISGNSTQGSEANGGGIYANGVKLVDSTVANNFTQGTYASGGGICTRAGGLTLTSSTVSGNSVHGINANAGGAYVGAPYPAHIYSSIIAGNHDYGNGSLNDLGDSGRITITNSLIGDSAGTNLIPSGPFPDLSGNLIGPQGGLIDPHLGMLQDNGGPTMTMALLSNSPAIDRGINAYLLATDQRGFNRVVGAQADMGAFEVQPRHLRVHKSQDTMDTVMDPNDLSLRDAILVANNNPGADTITFDPSLSGVPLKLSLGELLITDAVTIQGLGPSNISGQQLSRIFHMAPTAGNVTLDGLTLGGGRTTAPGDGGGAIRWESSGTLTIRHCTIAGNSTQGDSSPGGAICSVEPQGGSPTMAGTIVVINSLIANNFTAGLNAPGGGIWATGGLIVDASTIAHNFTFGQHSFGGGVVVDGDGTMLRNSTIYNNFTLGTAAPGGGIFVNGKSLTVINSTVSGNATAGTGVPGGGVYVQGPGGVTVTSSIVAGNRSSGSNPDLGPGTGPLTLANSLIGTNQGTTLAPTGLTPDANGNLIGSTASPIDPLLGPLQDNGGRTPTRALLPGSPAIGSGSNTLDLSTDQRGGDFARQAGSVVDMGAFQVQLQPPPPPPLALNDHVTVLENSGPNPLNVLANDRGSGLTVTDITLPLFGQAGALPGGIGIAYIPNQHFDGIDEFDYTVTDRDGRTATATVFVNVSGANMPPLAQPDTATVLDTGVAGSGQTSIDVLANDSGNRLRIVAVTQGGNGSVLLDPIDGLGLSYMANAGFSGSDSFTYTIRDDLGRTATATVTVTVVGTSTPMAHDDTVTVPANSPNSSGTSIQVLTNDTGHFVQVTAVTQPAHGSVTLMLGSPPVYQPNPNYLGPDSFTYTITDDKNQTSSATVNVTVVDTTTEHIQDQTATVPENGGPVGIDLLAHDIGTALFVTGVTQPTHGTVQPPIVDHRTVSYTPGPDFAGTDTFTFTVLNSAGQTVTANVTVTVVGPSAPLAALDDAVAVPAGSGPNPINVLSNDTGSGVHVTALTQGAHGAVVILPAGEGVSYQPNAGFTGTDQFTYTVTDAHGQTATATVRVSTVANFFPIAQVTGPATGQAGQTIAITASASDVSADPSPGFQYVVNWGDGSAPQTIPASPGNGGGVVVNHVYAVAGSYTVQVTAINQDGNTSPVATLTVAIAPTQQVVVQPVQLTPVFQSVGKGKHRRILMFVQVDYSNGMTLLVPVPFTKPRFRMVVWVLADLNHDGVFDTVVFTARLARTGKKVQRMVPV
jgi:hypothetical protein